jgi:hypothetical protein
MGCEFWTIKNKWPGVKKKPQDKCPGVEKAKEIVNL